MSSTPNLRSASRRFEFTVHEAVPESPQPMYQENTYGRTPSRLTGRASDTRGPLPEVETAAVFVLAEGTVVSTGGADEAAPAHDPKGKAKA